ncbi:MAG: deoxyhypusine synthase [Candidatus Woesearchaeota archaeon]|jgi:deoxyhypusine synthase
MIKEIKEYSKKSKTNIKEKVHKENMNQDRSSEFTNSEYIKNQDATTKKTEYASKQKHMARTTSLDNHPNIKGYDFEKEFDFLEFMKSYSTTGFQGTELFKGVEITNMMIEDKATIFLSFTGNAISSGLREIITYLVKNKLVHVLITSASGIEEDIIKSLNEFKLGDFDVQGRALFDLGVGRIGNIFVPNDRYLYFEKFMTPFFEKMLKKQKTLKRPIAPSEMAFDLGCDINNEGSYLYWAAKNNIPVFCPGIMDGSFGDLVYFFRQKNKDFFIDVAQDQTKLIDFVLQQEKTGAIILGGGISKHYALNAQIFREGFDYAVYLTTATEYDGSDSGGNCEEAKTWAKIKVNAPTAKIRSDFTITFPLLVAGSFCKNKLKPENK